MTTDRHVLKWVVAALGSLVAMAGTALFVMVRRQPEWLVAIMGPICLWWMGVGLVIALTAALSGPGLWPRDRRARYVAFSLALTVGGWAGATGKPLFALLAMPVYAALERVIMARLLPSDAQGAYVPLPIWLGSILLGEGLGYVLGTGLALATYGKH